MIYIVIAMVAMTGCRSRLTEYATQNYCLIAANPMWVEEELMDHIGLSNTIMLNTK